MTWHLGLAILVSLLQVGDMITTLGAARRLGPRFVEVNPLMRWAFAQVGMVPALLLKVGVMTAVAVGAALHYPSDLLLAALSLLVVVYATVVLHNARLR